MKQILRNFALLLGLASLSTAQAVADGTTSFSNVSGSFSWPVGDESKAVVSDGLADAVLSSGFSVGTDLTATKNGAYSSLSIEANSMMLYQPATSNAGCVSGDMIEYKIKMKKGLTFTPTSVVFDAVKEGTDGASFSWAYAIDGKENEPHQYDGPKDVRRNNNANPDAPLTHTEAISATGGREFALRFYISNTANNKKMAIGKIKINGSVSGEVEVRKFVDFKVDFRTESGIVVSKPASGELPAGVVIDGKFHDDQHGNGNTTLTIPTDGPVKLTIGSCQYGSDIAIKDAAGTELAKLSGKEAGCDSKTSTEHFITWVYNDETPTTLTVDVKGYLPFFYAEACELLQNVKIEYFNTDGKLIDSEEVMASTPLTYKVAADKVTVPAGMAFRGWFTSAQATALKVAEGTFVQDNLKLYARATKIETVSSTARYIYDINKASFYVEDHECIEMTGKYHDAQHGWDFANGQSIKVKVAGKAYITLGLCRYSKEADAVITNEAGAELDKFAAKAPDDADGKTYTYRYDGPATTLTITFSSTAYVHNVSVSNVVDFVDFDAATGYYFISSGDVSSFLIALADAKEGAKIFLANGVYDLGETVLTPVSGKNISIIGESMMGTIILNAPDKGVEGIGTTATLLNTADGLYMQDLTLQNALDYYGSGAAGRAVCLQDKGKNTICKNVRMLSYQDTYYSNASSNFYWEDCEIHGTVDYVCGGGDVVYNRTRFVNESRSKTGKSGDATIAAPNGAKKWGYVMLDCSIESNSATFNFGRSWGHVSNLAWIRTTIISGSLASSRFTVAGMNCAADKFVEYGTHAAGSDAITTPASNVINFTHKDGNKKYETVLTDEQAAEYTVANIFGEWAPDVIAAQKSAAVVKMDGGMATWAPVEGATAYLVSVDGKAVAIVGAETTSFASTGVVTVRAANSRGGFGLSQAMESAEPTVSADKNLVSTEFYTLGGVKVAEPACGIYVKKSIFSDGSVESTKVSVK